MKSLNGVGVGLSVVFGCLLLALLAELYYLLWWKKRATSEQGGCPDPNPHPDYIQILCWEKPPSSSQNSLNQEARQDNGLSPEDKDSLFKPPSEQERVGTGAEEELHKISGPPRFLFTIAEETKEDLESEDGKCSSRREKRILSDFLLTVENQTPYLTPRTSPSLFSPPITPTHNGDVGFGFGFNPLLFESCADAEFNRMRRSPPPKFKFLQDAEEKLRRRLAGAGIEGGRNRNGGDLLPSSNLRTTSTDGVITINV